MDTFVYKYFRYDKRSLFITNRHWIDHICPEKLMTCMAFRSLVRIFFVAPGRGFLLQSSLMNEDCSILRFDSSHNLKLTDLQIWARAFFSVRLPQAFPFSLEWEIEFNKIDSHCLLLEVGAWGLRVAKTSVWFFNLLYVLLLSHLETCCNSAMSVSKTLTTKIL